MNTDEQSLIDGLFSRLRQAETEGSTRDTQAEQRIHEHVGKQPAAPYYMAQAILVQEAAVKRLDQMNQQLQAELEQARAANAKAPAQSGGFLSGIFGGGPEPLPAPAQPASSGGGWREPARGSAPPQPPQYQPGYQQPAYQQPGYAQPQAAGGGFMRGALQTAAGVAGGVMLAEGISSLFHRDNPQEIVEIIREEPAPAADHGGDWGNDNNQQAVSDNNDWNNDSGGLSDTDYSGDSGGFLPDDDDYV